MLTCRICESNCDPGDLRDGICYDCRDKQEKDQKRKEKRERLLRSSWQQMEMEELIDGR